MKISQIYQLYPVPDNLAWHMLRVGAVGEWLINNLVNTHLVDHHILISTLLLHDLGNLVKFDLKKFASFLDSQLDNQLNGQLKSQTSLAISNVVNLQNSNKVSNPLDQQKDLNYWQEQQVLAIKNFGKDEYQATLKMVSQLSTPAKVLEILSGVSISNAKQIANNSDFNLKVALYADYRIAPQGLVSLDQRIDDLLVRYAGREQESELARPSTMEANRHWLKQIEQQLASQLKISINQLNSQLVEERASALQNYDI